MKITCTRDFLTAVVLSICLLILFGSTQELPKEVKMFPLAIMIIMTINIILLFVKSLTGDREKGEAVFHSQFIVIGLSLFVYYYALTSIGFYVASGLYALILYMYLRGKWNWLELGKGLCLSCILVGSLYIVFKVSLNLVTPKGILF
ncbi:tripartite tricarboxylate transporter TctB family protein [Alkalihalobacillus oceani]|uniref:Tripartite tricarboxylate transporter TctB family protein n=1 Tax=Halalkalibacter oceani TaxID=1653776 RepID=A0A9X2DV25_9BACI|nr:tripartite tricarboxylate transporter TctB family protein [Halalkalibacter oceani]MCM3716640.1 tripartite tricarboxylate transporter TctB family protein [Halalkalibacter oceani]